MSFTALSFQKAAEPELMPDKTVRRQIYGHNTKPEPRSRSVERYSGTGLENPKQLICVLSLQIA